jgi:hypothetical protein
MEKLKIVKALLIVAGLSGIVVGGALLFQPIAFQASAGIRLQKDVNILSEVRAPGGALLAGGVVILAGAFLPALTYTSVLFSALFFLSYGVSRILSMIVDGLPTTSLIMATIAEVIIGAVSIVILFNFQKKKSTSAAESTL